VVIYAVARAARLAWRDALLAAVALSQIGEFAFVLIAFAGQNGVLDGGTGGLLTACVALSMLTTPLLFIAFDRLVPGSAVDDGREPDAIEEKGRVIIAGFGRVGQIAGRILIGRGIPITVLEHDAEQLDTLRKFGFTLYYGDARRHDLLHAAGADDAALLVVATDDRETTSAIVEMARRNFPGLRIVARAYDRPHAYELETLGADRVVRETFAGGIEMGIEALKDLGLPAFEAERVGKVFRRHDVEVMNLLRDIRRVEDMATYGLAFRERREMLSRVLQRDIRDGRDDDETGWDSAPLREEARDRSE
jgi:voltage-gated potassium channel Kch